MPLKRIKTPRAIPIFPLWKLVLMPIPSSFPAWKFYKYRRYLYTYRRYLYIFSLKIKKYRRYAKNKCRGKEVFPSIN